MKTIKSVTLENGIVVKLSTNKNGFQITSSINKIPEKATHLDMAMERFDKRISMLSRLIKSTI